MKIKVVCFVLVLGLIWSCSDSNKSPTTDINLYSQVTCSNQKSFFRDIVFPQILRENCISCHKSGNVLDLNQTPVENFSSFKNASLKKGISGESLITTKAQGLDGHAGRDLYLSHEQLRQLKKLADAIEFCQSDSSDGLIKLSPYKRLRKLTFALASRLPTENEETAVKQASLRSLDSVFDQIIDSIMTEEGFYKRLKEIYNDLFLTYAFAPSPVNPTGSRMDLDLSSFVDRNVFADLSHPQRGVGYTKEQEQIISKGLNIGFSHAPLELIAHVVRNDHPFTEIMTADYVMVNPFTATLMGLYPADESFRFDHRKKSSLPDPRKYDPYRFLAVKIGKHYFEYGPPAGILSDPAFLGRYPSTNTNVNRHRSRIVYKVFLDTEAESFADRTALDLDNVYGSFPTIQDKQCKACHDRIDPIAGLFKNRSLAGSYRVMRWANELPIPNTKPPLNQMFDLGFYAKNQFNPMPPKTIGPLQWLANNIAKDSKFARVNVKHIFSGYVGHKLVNDSPFEEKLKTEFISNNYNLKILIKTILQSDYFTVASVESAQKATKFSNRETARLITPEQIQRKLKAVTGYHFRSDLSQQNLNYNEEVVAGIPIEQSHGGATLPILYGGIDSGELSERLTDPTPMINAIQLRMALQASCKTVPTDLAIPDRSKRRYFKNVSIGDVPEDKKSKNRIKKDIQFLHKLVLGEELALDDPSILNAYELFDKSRRLAAGKIINDQCRSGARADKKGSIQAWMAVLTYLLIDYKFLYE